MVKTGLVIGRFQPFHNGHEYLVLEALKDGCDRIIIGIGSAEKCYSPDNPFTGGERVEMIYQWAKDKNILDKVLIIPLRNVDRWSIWVKHVLSLIPPVDMVYIGDNEGVIKLFRMEGMKIKEMGRQKGISATIIRQGLKDFDGMTDAEKLTSLVLYRPKDKVLEMIPMAIYKYLESIDYQWRL